MIKIPIYFDERCAAYGPGHSPSIEKPHHAAHSMGKRFYGHAPHVEVEPFPTHALCLVHDPLYVTGVLAGSICNGHGTKSHSVRTSLPYVVGSLHCAAQRALDGPDGIACSPTSGFHHASYDHGAGFCTLNGLLASIRLLKLEGRIGRAAILDLDYHFGDGTQYIIDRLDLNYVTHLSSGAAWTKPDQAEVFLRDCLPAWASEIAIMKPSIIYYQAGADAHIDDPCGGWMTSEQLKRRDRFVFQTAHDLGIPIVWNLAGGYQHDFRKVLDIHDETFRQALEVYS